MKTPPSLLVFGTLADPGRKKSGLFVENALLQHLLTILRRQVKRSGVAQFRRVSKVGYVFSLLHALLEELFAGGVPADEEKR